MPTQRRYAYTEEVCLHGGMTTQRRYAYMEVCLHGGGMPTRRYAYMLSWTAQREARLLIPIHVGYDSLHTNGFLFIY